MSSFFSFCRRNFLKGFLILASFLALILLSACSLDTLVDKGTLYVLSVALDYKNTAVSDLDGTINDAIEFSECLRANYIYRNIPVEVTYMLQEGESQRRKEKEYPSAENVLNMIETFKGKVKKNDLFIFYYSGHGDVDKENGAFFAAGAESESELYTALYMNEVKEALDSLPCQSVAIIDACYSGNMKPEESASEISTAFINAVRGLELRKTVVLAACQRDTLSYVTTIYNEEGESERHSVMTIELLNALGWRHTRENTLWAESGSKVIRAHGTMGYYRESMSINELYQEIMSTWTSFSQSPVINNSGIDVSIIPQF